MKKIIVFLYWKLNSLLRFIRFMIQNYPLVFYIRNLKIDKIYENGKVTIITPTYKRLDKLQEAVESVLRQNYSLYEHIIVSDGYDKMVDKLIREINDPRIKYKYTFKLNTMGNYQRNFALKYATGEYLLYLDDDNVIYENCLKTMVKGFTSRDIGYVICPINYNDTVKSPKMGFKYREIDLLNYMVRRKIVEQLWGQPVHGVADYILINKVRRISKGAYISEIIGHHR